MKLRIPDSRFLILSTKAMTGEATTPQSRRDEGEAFLVGTGERKSRVGLADGKRGVRWRDLLALQPVQGQGSREKRLEPWGDRHRREAAQVVACQYARNWAARGRLC